MDKKVKQIIAKLQSKEEKEVLKAIEDIRKHGNNNVLPALFNVMFTSGNQNYLSAGTKVLHDLKDNTSVDFIMEAMQNEEFSDYQNILVSALWEAGLDCSDRLEELVEVAAYGNYLTTLEVLTVIENMDGGFPYEQVTECALTINERLDEIEDDNHKALLVSLSEVLNSMVGN